LYARFRDQRVPTLQEVLSWARGRISLVIEIKGDPHFAPELGEELVDVVEQYGMQDSVAIISFHHPVAKHVKALAPELATGIICTGRLADPVGAARAANADYLWPQWSYWTREDVETVHGAGLVAHAWNADAKGRMERNRPDGRRPCRASTAFAGRPLSDRHRGRLRADLRG
jgi:glycerophosphoryl diester phosphodiesterase